MVELTLKSGNQISIRNANGREIQLLACADGTFAIFTDELRSEQKVTIVVGDDCEYRVTFE